MSPVLRTPTKSGRKETNSFKTTEDAPQKLTPFKTIGSQKLTHFKTPAERVKKLNPRYMVPVNEASLVISDPQTADSSTNERTALKRSTTKRTEIQPHLHRARFNIYQKYQESSSIIPQQL